MKTHLPDFIRFQILKVEKAISAREEASKVWRGGTSRIWRSVGCTASKPERIAIADREDRILKKLRHELEMFNEVLEALLVA
jgi:hypothetical protein